ncbi:MAG TPA: MOSC domain-containing protein, partial [Gammaproteobacteria bacterium]|nr:MOSC domain-containing protein [Gammaproteobacteria bacterium]
QVRQVDQDYASAGDKTAFSDGFPILLISQASLDDLNNRLDEPMPMKRFRPNLVVTGTQPYEEDQWQRISINGVEFRIVKPCSRCIVTTIDPETGKQTGVEPLETLGTYRKQGGKVMFGQNVIPDGSGVVALGDEVVILE